MKLRALFVALPFLLSACATIENDLPLEENSGGAGSGGTPGGGSGGTLGAGNSSSGVGGTATGGASTGGAPSGGAASGGAGTGGLSTGGAASGGASTGGAGTGGSPVITEGDCAGSPTRAGWTSQAIGDEVVIQCAQKQASCAPFDVGVDILWRCAGGASMHLGNCVSQDPWGSGDTWVYVRTCTNEEPTEESSP